MNQFSGWVHAARLRTLPLAVSSILMGGILAYIDGYVNIWSFALAILTTVLLQVLSNFANDYGDFTSGVDVKGRIGPSRALQSGRITRARMKQAIIITAVLTFILGLLLLITSELGRKAFIVLLLLGVSAIIAAITYTIGSRPYGYRGMGDIAVFIFFGMVGVIGSHWIIHGEFKPHNIWMAATSGFFSVGVLNLNNMRDRDADELHDKNTIPVLIGLRKSRVYHALLLMSGWAATLIYSITYSTDWYQWLFLLSLPLFIYHLTSLSRRNGADIDPLLKQLALSTLIFVLLFGIGWVLL